MPVFAKRPKPNSRHRQKARAEAGLNHYEREIAGEEALERDRTAHLCCIVVSKQRTRRTTDFAKAPVGSGPIMSYKPRDRVMFEPPIEPEGQIRRKQKIKKVVKSCAQTSSRILLPPNCVVTIFGGEGELWLAQTMEAVRLQCSIGPLRSKGSHKGQRRLVFKVVPQSVPIRYFERVCGEMTGSGIQYKVVEYKKGSDEQM